MDREKVMNGLQAIAENKACQNCCYPYMGHGVICGQEIARDAVVLLKEQEPKTPIHIHEEYPEHDWETDKDGNIDDMAMDYDFHNGPRCKRCGYSFCIFCKPNGWNEEPCIIDYYLCPKCGKRILKGKNIKYCVDCGQAVKWNE